MEHNRAMTSPRAHDLDEGISGYFAIPDKSGTIVADELNEMSEPTTTDYDAEPGNLLSSRLASFQRKRRQILFVELPGLQGFRCGSSQWQEFRGMCSLLLYIRYIVLDLMPTHRSSTWGRRHSAATNIEHATQVCILMRSHHLIDAIDHEVASDGE